MSDQSEQRPAPKPLTNVFSDMLRETDQESAGKPFYDKTLNFLYTSTMRTQANAQKLRAKIEKQNQQLNDLWAERDTGQAVFIREYNKRTVTTPEGEIIPNPFAPDAGSTDDDE